MGLRQMRSTHARVAIRSPERRQHWIGCLLVQSACCGPVPTSSSVRDSALQQWSFGSRDASRRHGTQIWHLLGNADLSSANLSKALLSVEQCLGLPSACSV
jgi:hypothetical protein